MLTTETCHSTATQTLQTPCAIRSLILYKHRFGILRAQKSPMPRPVLPNRYLELALLTEEALHESI